MLLTGIVVPTLHKKLLDRYSRGVEKLFDGRSGTFLSASDLGEKLLWGFGYLALTASTAHGYGNCCSCIWIVVAATDRALSVGGLGDFAKKSDRVFFKLSQASTAAETYLDLDGSAAIGGFSFYRADFIHWTGEDGQKGQH